MRSLIQWLTSLLLITSTKPLTFNYKGTIMNKFILLDPLNKQDFIIETDEELIGAIQSLVVVYLCHMIP